MADHPVRSSGVSEVPLGGRAVVSITTEESGVLEDVTSVRVLWKDNSGTTLSNETRTSSDISTTATDGGAITITNPAGTGTYQATYTVPNDATYSPPAGGLEFSVQVFIVDEDGNAQTEAVSFFVVPADITVSFDSQAISSIVKRRARLIDEVLHVQQSTGSNGERIDLGEGPIYAIEAAYKNGTAITGGGTDYTWNTFSSSLTVVAAPAANDHYLFRVQRRVRDDLVDDYVNEATDQCLARLRLHYAASDLVTTPTFEMIAAMLATGRLKKELARGATLDNPEYRSGLELEREATAMLDAISRGESGVMNASGTSITRKTGAVAGGKLHADGVASGRLDLLDRAQKWTQIFLPLYPERDPDDALDPRSL